MNFTADDINLIEYERKTLNLDWFYEKKGPHYYKFRTFIKRSGAVQYKSPDGSESNGRSYKESEIKDLFEKIAAFIDCDNFEMEHWFDDSVGTVIIYFKDGNKERFDRGLKREFNGTGICLYELIVDFLGE